MANERLRTGTSVVAFALTLARYRDATSSTATPAVKVEQRRRSSRPVMSARAGSFVFAIEHDTKAMLLGNRSRHLLADAALRRLARGCWCAMAAPIPTGSGDDRCAARLVGPRAEGAAARRLAIGLDHFTRFAAIDWSGAKGDAPSRASRWRSARRGDAAPALVEPPARRLVAHGRSSTGCRAPADEPLLVGFDFSFAPPFIERGAYLPGEDTPR